MKIKKNDLVLVIKGKDKNKTGKVLKALPKIEKVIVEGVNLVVRHFKPRTRTKKGQKLLVAKPIRVANVKILCPKCKKATRVGYKVFENEKLRLCKKCGKTFK